ncbi:MAG: ADYC domain-containing protein [Nannocystaceae bacterium]
MPTTKTTLRPLSRAALTALTVGVGLLGAACDQGALGEASDAIAFRPGGGWGCTQCGLTLGNSPNINGAELSDVHLDAVNTSGIKVRLGTGPLPDALSFALEVDMEKETFVAVDPGDRDVELFSGADFVGAKIALEMPNGGGTVTLVITDYDEEVESWAAGGAPLVAYKAEYMNGNAYTSLCPSTSPENQWFTLIAGEIYDRDSHLITPSSRSVSIACVGEAAAKMKLMDFHPQGNRGASVDERTATLRMITADYCGDGTSYTATGVPVAWRDVDGMIEPPTEENYLEAIWTKDGARCLDIPRLHDRDTIHCSIPECEGMQELDKDAGDVWRTMLPSLD